MKKVEIEQLNGGFWVKLITKDACPEYVYNDESEFRMMNDIGKFLLDMKIKTERA